MAFWTKIFGWMSSWPKPTTMFPNTHSRIWPYFISYLLTCEVDLFEVIEIMAEMWHYINSFSHKPTKVTSDFILNYLKKVIGDSEKFKNKY